MRRNLLHKTIAVAALLLIVGCTAKAPSPPKQTSDGGGQRVTIKLLAYPTEALQAVITQFNETHPDARVVLNPLEWTNFEEVAQQIEQKVAAGEVDIMEDVVAGTTFQLVREHQLVDLGPLLAKSNLDPKVFGSALTRLELDGHLYNLPYRMTPWVLAYNADLFKAAGVTPPQPGKAWTWDEFRTTAARLTTGKGEARVWGFDSENMVSAVRFIAGADDRTPAHLRDGLQLATTMVFTDHSMPPLGKPGEVRNPFHDQTAAMTIDSLENMTNSVLGFNWDLAPLPTWPGEERRDPVPQTYTMSITATGKHQASAWAFLSFMAGPEGAKVLATYGYLNAYRTPAAKEAWFSRQPPQPASTEMLFDPQWASGSAPAQGRSLGAAEQIQSQGQKIQETFGAVLRGEQKWEDALVAVEAAQAQMRELQRQ